MDTDHLLEPSNVRPSRAGRSTPIISWISAGNLTEINDYWDDGLGSVDATESKPNGRAFALIVEGLSMTDYTLGAIYHFPPGTRLIVDPDMACGPNNFVIAKDVQTQQATFKQLVTDGGRWYLRPLNREFPTIEVDSPELRLIGRVCEWIPKGRKL